MAERLFSDPPLPVPPLTKDQEDFLRRKLSRVIDSYRPDAEDMTAGLFHLSPSRAEALFRVVDDYAHDERKRTLWTSELSDIRRLKSDLADIERKLNDVSNLAPRERQLFEERIAERDALNTRIDEWQRSLGSLAEQERNLNCDLATKRYTCRSEERKLVVANAARDRLAIGQALRDALAGYFGADRTWPQLAHHTILLGRRYRELLEDIFERKILAEDFSLYLHAPTRSDPGVAPPGHEAFYVLSPVPNMLGKIDWDAIGPRYFDTILDFLDADHVPGLKASIVTRKHITPQYFETTLRSHHGAAFGPEPLLHQSAFFRYHNRSEDVEGPYFVGAGTHPGAGMPGVLSSAKVLARVMPGPQQRGIGVQDKKSISHSGASSTTIYQKGSQVLEMLKYVTGREAFNKSVKRNLLNHKYANVDSDDLLMLFRKN